MRKARPAEDGPEPVDKVDRLSRTCKHVLEGLQAAARIIWPKWPNATLAA